jgi:hypothetical protein
MSETMSVEVRESGVESTPRQDARVSVQGGALAYVFRDVYLLLLGLWLGASLFFSFVVAPGAFAVLRDSTALYANHLAGSIVTRNLAVINTSGFMLSLLLLVSAFVFRGSLRRAAFIMEVASLVVMAVATGAGQWVIAAKMLALRAQMGRPIDETAASDPLRLAFNSLHGYSGAALTVAMLAALCAFVLIARRAGQLGFR